MRDEEFQALKAAKKAAKRAAKEAKEEGSDAKKQKSDSMAKPALNEPAPAAAPAAAAEPTVTESAWSETSTETKGKAKDSSSDWYADKWLPCGDCGTEFLFSANEQKFFWEKGWTNAKSRCSECTAAKKARFGEKAGKGTAAEQRLASTTCYTCGEKGHASKNCPQASCYNCGSKAHKSKDCPEPRKPEAGVCFKFQSGQCTRGETCRFAHVMQ